MDSQFNCFSVDTPLEAQSGVFVPDIGPDGVLRRHRKVHAKSRYGCKNCKERKVKVGITIFLYPWIRFDRFLLLTAQV